MTVDLVAGRFRLTSLLGSGGTAAVFAAEDERMRRRVALKLLHPHLAAEPASWEAFFEEVRAARSIAHPLLAEIFDAGVQEGNPPVVWIAMELVEGVTLEDHVRERGPLDPAAARTLADGMLDALAAVHGGGVVHRDLTPANVMFDPGPLDPFDAARFRDGIRLLDFGLADVPGRSTRGSDALLAVADGGAGEGVVASVPYASPEQLSGAPVTEASDVYQAGATIYFALTGQAPFRGSTAAVIAAHLSAPPPVPSARRRGIPSRLDRVVAGAMLKRPEDRYPDAAAMRRALAAAPAPAPVTTSVPTKASAVTALMPLSTARDAPEDRRTAVYPTAIPLHDRAPDRADRTALPGVRRSRAPIWLTSGAGAAAIIGVIALSAAAGSAPAVVPTSTTTAPVPTAAAPPPAPSVDATPGATPGALAEVPAIVGMTLPDASAALVQRGLMTGAVTRLPGTAPRDTVLAADPPPAARRPPGSSVALEVASGENLVPEVRGLPVADAAGLLGAAGLIGTVEEADAGEPGAVASTWPTAGAVVPLGTTIVLRVGRAAPAATSTPTSPSTPPPSTPTPTPTRPSS